MGQRLPFSINKLKKIEDGKYYVETRDGRRASAARLLEIVKKECEKEWIEEEENPVVEHLEDSPIPDITKQKHIKELQELLVQTCIDYINKNGLTDIDNVSFNADALNESAKYGSWQACTDSYIRVEGIRNHRLKRKNGEIDEIPYRYKIGEYM